MPLKVFYLDDEPDLLEMFVDLFASDEISVTTSADVARARAVLAQERFDVIFLDYRLPGITGVEFAREIPEGPVLVLITGDLNVRTGPPFAEVFTKPYRREDVFQFLRRQLSLASHRP